MSVFHFQSFVFFFSVISLCITFQYFAMSLTITLHCFLLVLLTSLFMGHEIIQHYHIIMKWLLCQNLPSFHTCWISFIVPMETEIVTNSSATTYYSWGKKNDDFFFRLNLSEENNYVSGFHHLLMLKIRTPCNWGSLGITLKPSAIRFIQKCVVSYFV